MSMPDEQCYVIKNEDGYYVNAKFRALFTGITSGFSGYGDENEARKDLERLGRGYHLEYINLKDVPKGERIYKD